MAKDISQEHQESKEQAYWQDLTGGTTSQYKEAAMLRLVTQHLPKQLNSLIDIGCGTCETILKYQKLLGATRLTCTDYDAKVIEKMKAKHGDKGIDWVVQDIFDLSLTQGYDLVFLLDMIHEIYSFYGRPNRNQALPVDHEQGQNYVKKALTNIARLVNPKGGILLTDNLLSEHNQPVTLRCNSKQITETINEFKRTYPTRPFNFELDDQGCFTLNAHDFCILLTQYNKIKNADHERYAVERLEIHQYMTLAEYQAFFDSIGFDLYYEIGTPAPTVKEWEEDFEILQGLAQFPEKRISLLAQRR